MLLGRAIWNAAAKDLDLLTVNGHLDACDMDGRWLLFVRELDAVRLGTSDHPLLPIHGELIERNEIVHPAHRQDVAAALSSVAGRNERHAGGQANGRVGGAVDEAFDVPPAPVREAGLLDGKLGSVSHRKTPRPGRSASHTRLGAAQPQPRIVLDRWRHVAVPSLDRFKRSEVDGRGRWRHGSPQLSSEPGREVHSPGRDIGCPQKRSLE